MPTFISLAFTNAAPGRDDDYNAWCAQQHLPDVLAVPGVAQAQRFELCERSRAALGFRYLSLYRIEADALADVHREIAARSGTPLMPRTDSGAVERLFLDGAAITPLLAPSR